MDTQPLDASDAPSVDVLEVQAFERHVPTRMPFRFGAATMTALTIVHLRVRIVAGGREAVGVGASVLSPMWFEKDPSRGLEQRTDNLLMSMSQAAAHYRHAGTDTAYALHQVVQPEVRRRCRDLGIPALPSSFGVALMDSAVVDALCRMHGSTFHAGLASDLFGFGAVPWLPERPTAALAIRHTVGLVDPLVAGDVTTRLDDGLPETLEEVIKDYGCSYFKLKIAGDVEADIDRLCRVAEVLQRETQGDYRAVLDGNEQFADVAAFVPFVEALDANPRLQAFRERLLWIEQPVEREASLEGSVTEMLRHTSNRWPVILDESDGTDEVVERALALGYGGVSAKNCKGVFRTLHSRRVLADRIDAGIPAILSAEDLTNPSVLPLHQDTAVVAALGFEHAERNGHHYVRGLDSLTEGEQETALRDFPSLYERRPDGLVRLCIRDGVIQTRELCAQGYGTTTPIDFEALEPLTLPAPGAMG